MVVVPFGGLWLDWLSVVRHAPADWTYSLGSLPMVAIPIVLWARRTRELETFATRARLRGLFEARPIAARRGSAR
jgi:hypothetical protein